MDNKHQKLDTNNTMWYRRTWAVVAMLILFFPVGIYLMWKSGWKKKTKILISCLIIALTAITIISAILAPPSIELSDMKTNPELIIESEN